MKRNKNAPACLMAGVLLAVAAATTANAAAPALSGQILPRPLTPGEITNYKLPASMEVSGGLTTVGVGQPVYLEAEVNIAIPPADILGVNWTLASQPVGSAAGLTNSPLGTNVGVYEPADRLVLQVAGRTLLRPDMTGQYTVTATITTASEGTTNLSLTINAGTYKGVGTCALCHSGGIEAQDMVHSWQTTAHSSIFTHGINGDLGHYAASCLPCHTAGYDTTASAVNGGFDDVMKTTGWIFPTLLTNSNWAAMPSKLQNLANIQCENCHGPGSEHASALGDITVSNWPRLSVTTTSGDCNQCHDAPTHHVKGTEWYSSKHAITTRDPAGSAGCVGCHTANGFIARIAGVTNNVDVSYGAIGCQTCHEPHGQTIPTNNPHLLRTLATVKLQDGTTVTTAGEGTLCMNCHMSRQNATNYVETTAGNSHYGPHHGPQGDMFMGANGVTYGKSIPSSAHRQSVTNACVTCHMQTTATTDPTFLLAGGHTFNMSCTNNGTNYDMVAACQQCHGKITSFNFLREDYNGDGIIEGVQTEVQKLLDQLGLLLPPIGQAKATIAIDATWTKPQLRAGYNYLFVQSDGSMGVHNVAYAVGLLKASISDLTGLPNSTGLLSPSQLAYYIWQVKNFGTGSNPNAAPNAMPAGDGIPNWLKYNLGLTPTVAGMTNVNGGIVWVNGTSLGGNSPTNAVEIFTAAEIAFNTTAGLNYQIQSISSMGDGWQNVSGPIAGTGTSISYTTPTRKNAQQFFRVIQVP